MRVIALEYHDVVRAEARDSSGFPGRAADSYKLLRSEFEQHLRVVSDAVGSRMTVYDLSDGHRQETPVLFTFDDGGASAYTEIADLLEANDWRGHFFVPTDYVGRPGFLTSTEIQDLRCRGHVIGSHSCSHPPRMARCSWEELVREWTVSAKILSEILGEPVTVASVPGGSVSERVVAAAAYAGIRTLFTSKPVMRARLVDGCVVLGRFTLRRKTPSSVAAQLVSGRLRPRAVQWAAWRAKTLLKWAAGPLYTPLWHRIIDRRPKDAT